MTERPGNCGTRGEHDPECARIRRMLPERGVPPAQITKWLINFWIVQDAEDEEESRSLVYQRPSRWFFVSAGGESMHGPGASAPGPFLFGERGPSRDCYARARVAVPGGPSLLRWRAARVPAREPLAEGDGTCFRA